LADDGDGWLLVGGAGSGSGHGHKGGDQELCNISDEQDDLN